MNRKGNNDLVLFGILLYEGANIRSTKRKYIMRSVASSGVVNRRQLVPIKRMISLNHQQTNQHERSVPRKRRVFTFYGNKRRKLSGNTSTTGSTHLGASARTNASIKGRHTPISAAQAAEFPNTQVAKSAPVHRKSTSGKTLNPADSSQPSIETHIKNDILSEQVTTATNISKQDNETAPETKGSSKNTLEPEPVTTKTNTADKDELVNLHLLMETDSPKSKIQHSMLHFRKASSPKQRRRILQYKSPVQYRKVFYDENEHKWIQHQIFEEDYKTSKSPLKPTEKSRSKIGKPHQIKGRRTTVMRQMLPTAFVKLDNSFPFYNIQITDPLRIDLYKRKMPVVPTYFQEHIYKFGKLPFRNNPRPH